MGFYEIKELEHRLDKSMTRFYHFEVEYITIRCDMIRELLTPPEIIECS